MKQTKTIFLRSLLLFCGVLFYGFAMGQSTLSGTVTDTDGVPLIGANVGIMNSDLGTTTDLDGKFSLSAPDSDQTLVISYLGYSTQSISINNENRGSSLVITMAEDKFSLDEIIVTGTFSQRTQKESPNSLTVLNSKQLSRLASNSQADILRTVPGITAEGGGGEVATNLFVRGFPSGGAICIYTSSD